MEQIWGEQEAVRWLDQILQRRRDGTLLVLLTPGPDGILWGIGRHPGSKEYEWWGLSHPREVPRPSTAGIGEWIHLQEDISRDTASSITWVPPSHPERVVRGKGIFTYPLGPVHGDVSESLRYDLAVMGDEIVHLTLKHGYKRRHITTLCRGKTVPQALELIERMTATSSFAHQWAFMMAVENAQGKIVDEGTKIYRSVALEMERLASHLGDLALLASSTGLPVAQMDYLHLKEQILRWNYKLFGDRYLRGALVKNALNQVADEASASIIAVGEQAQAITDSLFHTPSFLDRLVGAGTIPEQTVQFIAPVGPVGRASGLKVDVRSLWDYGVYDEISFAIPSSDKRDAYARFLVKSREITASVNIIRRLLPVAPRHSHVSTVFEEGPSQGPGIGMVEAPRGMLAYALWLDGSGEIIRHVAVATPSARNWYVVPPAMANGNILQDFPIIDASFLLSVAGWDQ